MLDLIVSVPNHYLSFYFIIRCLDSIIPLVSISKSSRL